jgi:hypothetical protein
MSSDPFDPCADSAKRFRINEISLRIFIRALPHGTADLEIESPDNEDESPSLLMFVAFRIRVFPMLGDEEVFVSIFFLKAFDASTLASAAAAPSTAGDPSRHGATPL